MADRVVVSSDATEAARLVREGRRVVLIVAEGGDVPGPFEGPGEGRLAVLMAEPGDPASARTAAEMGADVFGP